MSPKEETRTRRLCATLFGMMPPLAGWPPAKTKVYTHLGRERVVCEVLPPVHPDLPGVIYGRLLTPSNRIIYRPLWACRLAVGK